MSTVTLDAAHAPSLTALTDDDLAGLYDSSDDDTRAAVLAEMGRRDRADRLAKARGALTVIRAEAECAVHAQFLAASEVCRGRLLSREGFAAGVREADLWRMPARDLQRFASEELRDYFTFVQPRITVTAYVRQRAAQARAERIAALDSNGGNHDRNDGDTGTGLAGYDAGALRPDPAATQAPQAGPGRDVQRGGPHPLAARGTDHDGSPGRRPGGPVQHGRVDDQEGEDMGVIRTAVRIDRALKNGQQQRQAADGNGAGRGAAPEQPYAPEPLAPGAARRMPLDEARKFSGEIWWTDDVQLDVMTAALAATHTLQSFNTIFRVLVRSREKRTGKTTASDLAELLGHCAWRATQSTPYAVKAKFNEAEPPFIIAEEIQKRFGVNGLSGSKDPLAAVLLDGYRRTATTPLSVDRTSVDIPAYCAAFLNGRGQAVHDDIADRCIIFDAKRKPAGITMPRNSLDQDTWAEGSRLRDALHAYVKNLEPVITQLQRRWRPPHPLFTDRLDQIWRPVYLLALASDVYERELWEKTCAMAAEQGLPEPPRPACDWAERVMSGFRLLALDNSDIPPLLNEQIALRDAARWFRSGGGWKDPLGRRFGFAADLKEWLVAESGEPLWTELTERAMERLFTEALGETVVLTHNPDGDAKRRARGWAAGPVIAGWDALEASFLPSLPDAPDEVSMFDDLPPEDDEDEDDDHSNHGTDSETAGLR